MTDKNEMTAPIVSVGADTEQSIQTNTDNSITNPTENFNGSELSFQEYLRATDPFHLNTVSMTELFDSIYRSKPPLMDGLLYRGTYLFVGAPKLGKSFLMAQLAYHISTGTPLWGYPTRGDTEWNQWAQAEKEALASIMERYGIEWEHKGSHEQHLSVLDYKKQEREKEITALNEQIADKTDEVKSLEKRVLSYDEGINQLQTVRDILDTAPEYALPEPTGLMSAKTYKTKFAEPLIQKLKALLKTALARYFEAWDNYHRLNATNGRLYRENQNLIASTDRLYAENQTLRSELKDYKLLRKVFGSRQIDALLEQAKQSKQRGTRFRKHNDER